MQLQIAPSILSADFLNLGRDIQILNKSADLIHLDVMDGVQVPNLSFGFSVTDAVSSAAKIPMDAHLMICAPAKYADRFIDGGVSYLSFHLEATGDGSAELLSHIRSRGVKAGLAINPDVPVSRLFPYIGKADFFLIMSVFAGFGGQKFIPESIDRIAMLRERLVSESDPALIEVDGGVGTSNIKELYQAGASMFVAGSAVFKGGDPAAAIQSLREAAL